MNNNNSNPTLIPSANEELGSIMQRNNYKVTKSEIQKVAQTPCRFYQLGQCSKGSKCTFMHKKAPHFAAQCKFFVNGFCRNGDRCTFSHQAPHLNRRKSSSDVFPSPLKNPTIKSPAEILKKRQDQNTIIGSSSVKNGYHSNINRYDYLSKNMTGIFNDDLNGQIQTDENQLPYSIVTEEHPFFFMDDNTSYPDITENVPYYDSADYSPEPLKRHYNSFEDTEDAFVSHRAGSLPQSPLWSNVLSPDIWGGFTGGNHHLRVSQSLPESVGNWGDDNSFFSFDTNSLVSSPSSQRTPKSSFLSSPTNKPLFNTLDEQESMILPTQASSPPQNDKSLPISIPNKSDNNNSNYIESHEGSRYYYREGPQASTEPPLSTSQNEIYSPYPLTTTFPQEAPPPSVFVPEDDVDEFDDIEFDEMNYAFQAAFLLETADTKDSEYYSVNNSNGNLIYFPHDELVDADDIFDHSTSDGMISSVKIKNKKKKTPKKNKEKKNSPTEKLSSKEKQLCSFYLEGNCRYGQTCRNIHGNYCNICNKPALIPLDDEQNEKHNTECSVKRQMQEELELSKNYKCECCKQKVLENNNRFGLLTECTHCFCLKCIKDWRSETQKSECPVCNVVSHFVVPSNVMVTDRHRKSIIIQNYKEKMKQIPCKYFDSGKGVCKFGSNCHYAHVDITTEDTNLNTSSSSVSKPSPSENHVNGTTNIINTDNRTLTDAQGEAVPINTLNLGMFLTYNIKPKEQNKSSTKK